MQTKCCRRCGEVKNADMFTRASRSPDGLHAFCKACRSKANAASQRTQKGGDATYVWPRNALERSADIAIREWRTVRPVTGVFAPSLGLSA